MIYSARYMQRYTAHNQMLNQNKKNIIPPDITYMFMQMLLFNYYQESLIITKDECLDTDS